MIKLKFFKIEPYGENKRIIIDFPIGADILGIHSNTFEHCIIYLSDDKQNQTETRYFVFVKEEDGIDPSYRYIGSTFNNRICVFEEKR